MPEFDAIVIGTGQSGPSLAKDLAAAGQRVAIIERKHFGGTCINVGCTPTKTMIASARIAHMARRAADFGVAVGAVAVDYARVKARKDAIVREWSGNTEKSLRATPNLTVVKGHARFTGAHAVTVAGEALHGERIFLNVGARASAPDIAGLDGVPWLTNVSMLDLPALPRHLVIVGGNYIGLEFGQMYRRFGAEVTVVERGPRLIMREDEEFSSALHHLFAAEGVHVHCGAHDLAVAREGDGVRLQLVSDAGPASVSGSHLLIAAGRRPNTDDLGLDRAGVAVDERGFVRVDDTLRTNVPHIWALGDCNGRGAFTHTSYDDYAIVAGNMLRGAGRSVRDRVTAYALFTDPPLGRAGLTEGEARKAGKRVLVASMPMAEVGRAIERDETVGLMKLVADADTKELLGGAILGIGGDEAIHCIIDLIRVRAPCTVLQRAMHIHPTVSEYWPVLAEELKATPEGQPSSASE